MVSLSLERERESVASSSPYGSRTASSCVVTSSWRVAEDWIDGSVACGGAPVGEPNGNQLVSRTEISTRKPLEFEFKFEFEWGIVALCRYVLICM